MLMQAGGTYEAVELWVICPHFFDVRIYISLYILNRALNMNRPKIGAGQERTVK